MKMIKMLIMTIAAFAFPLAMVAQTKDLFSYENGNIVPKREFFSSSTKDVAPLGNSVATYVHKKVMEGFISSVNNPVAISFVGTSKMSEDETYDAIRIFSKDGKKLLERWGYNPLRSVEGQTMQPYTTVRYIKVPLDNDTFALILGGVLFDGVAEAPEMMIVVVKENQAKVVFDGPAMAFHYSAPPVFSIDFVEEMDWATNDYGNSDAPFANPLPSRTKYRIWKEGNMLKYTSWK